MKSRSLALVILPLVLAIFGLGGFGKSSHAACSRVTMQNDRHEPLLTAIARGFSKRTGLESLMIVNGMKNLSICSQSRQHAKYMATEQKVNHDNMERRKDTLFGLSKYRDDKTIKEISMSEIAVDSGEPNLDPEKAATACIDGWYSSEFQHRPVLVQKPYAYCMSMAKCEDDNLYYCVGLAIYIKRR